MHELQTPPAVGEAQARERLRSEFPQVPPRVITSVLAAYRRITPTVSEAVEAARARIMDARAI